MIATDPLSLLFLGCALFAGLFLVATVALGAGHGHFGHVGHAPAHVAVTHATPVAHIGAGSSPQTATHGSAHGATSIAESGGLWAGLQSALLGSLSLNGALIFLLVFGVLGYLLHSGQGGSIFLVVALATLVGALAAIGVNAALARIFITSQAGELSADSSRLEGRLATVSMAIRPQGLGVVVFTGEAGARQSIGARSSDGAAIEAGAQVVIVEAERGVATVQPWDTFLEDSRQRPSANAAIEAQPAALAPALAQDLTPGQTPGPTPGLERATPTAPPDAAQQPEG